MDRMGTQRSVCGRHDQDFSCTGERQVLEQRGDARQHIGHARGAQAQHHDGKGDVAEILLVGQAFVGGDKYVELARFPESFQQASVFDSAPTHIIGGLDRVMGRQYPSQIAGQALVEEETYLSGDRFDEEAAGLLHERHGFLATHAGELSEDMLQKNCL